jgi:hypothetical protein
MLKAQRFRVGRSAQRPNGVRNRIQGCRQSRSRTSLPARPEASHGRPRRFQRGTCGPWRRSRGVRQPPRAQAPARRKRAHQIARIGLVAQPWSVVAGRQDHRHPIMDFGHHLVGLGGDYRERPDPFTRCWLFPVLPQPSDAERRALLHRNGIRPPSLLTLDRFPLEEAIDRHDACGASGRRRGRSAGRAPSTNRSTNVL